MSKAIEITKVTVNNDFYFVTYITGTERKYPSSKLPKTVQKWLSESGNVTVDVEKVEEVKEEITMKNEIVIRPTKETKKKEKSFGKYVPRTNSLGWIIDTAILAVLYGVLFAASQIIKGISSLMFFIANKGEEVIGIINEVVNDYRNATVHMIEYIVRFINNVSHVTVVSYRKAKLNVILAVAILKLM